MKNIQEEITNRFIRDLHRKFDEIVKEGLRLKGHEFKHEGELIYFISNNCIAEDYTDQGIKIYYVNEVPFLEHHYQSNFNGVNKLENGSVSMSADLGSYRYL